MKALQVFRAMALLLTTLIGSPGQAQTEPASTYPNGTTKPLGTIADVDTAAMNDSTVAKLDQALAANAKGDKAATVAALQASTTALEAEANQSTGDFKSKLQGHVNGLKKLIPLARNGVVGGSVLSKAVSLVKMALGANRLSNLLGGGSLLGKASALSGGLNLMKGGLSALGGAAQSSGGSLINKALGAVAQLNGPTATTAEPAVKSSISSVLNLAKGIL